MVVVDRTVAIDAAAAQPTEPDMTPLRSGPEGVSRLMDPRRTLIIAFAGSLRTDSSNKKLARAMAAGAELAGAEVRFLDLKEYPVPVLDADLFDAENSDPHRLFDEGGRVGPPHD